MTVIQEEGPAIIAPSVTGKIFPSPAPITPRNRIAYIDALRSIAVIGALLFHSGQAAQLTGHFGKITAGIRGVQIFYIISALTMLTISARELNPRSFFIRRVFRIGPMFWLAAIVSLILYGFSPRYYAPQGIDGLDVFLTFTFLHAWRLSAYNSVVPGGWSIGCEMMFYLVFPILRHYVTDLKKSILLFLSMVVLSHIAFWAGPHFIHGPRYLVMDAIGDSIICQMPTFATGFIVYFAVRKWSTQPILLKLSAPLLTLGIIASAVLAWYDPSINNYTLETILIGFMIFNIALCQPLFLVNPVTKLMGNLSYSVFVLHLFVVFAFGKLPLGSWSPGARLCIIFFGSTLTTSAVALLTYRWIEQPFIKLGHRLANRQPAAPMVAG